MNINKIQLNKAVAGIVTLVVLPFTLSTSVAYAAFGGYVTPYNSTSSSYPVNQYSNEPTINPKPFISYITPNSSGLGVGTKTININGTGFIPYSVGRINSSQRATTFIDSNHILMQVSGGDILNYQNNGGFYISVYNGNPGGGYSNAVFFTITGGLLNTSNDNQNVSQNNYGYDYGNFNEVNQYGNNSNVSGSNNQNNGLASSALFSANGIYPRTLIQWVFVAILILLIVILVRRIYGGWERYHAIPLKHD